MTFANKLLTLSLLTCFVTLFLGWQGKGLFCHDVGNSLMVNEINVLQCYGRLKVG